MDEERLEKLLNELAGMTAETARPSLAEDIKSQIPERLTPHKGGMDTINIMINLKVNKLAAAAVIILTMILLASLLSGSSTDGDIYQDGKLLLRHYLAGQSSRGDELAGMAKLYEYLIGQGKDVAYYGDSIDTKDSNQVLMQWKVAGGKYKVILVNFGTLSVDTVTADELIELQGRMIRKKQK